MKPHVRVHLSVDELDDFHAGRAAVRATSHIETCADCRALVADDIRLVAALENLRTWDPGIEFTTRVMEQVAPRKAPLAAPTAVAHSDRERSARRRVLVGGTLVGGLVTGAFAWASINPELALGLAEPAWRDLTGSLWVTVQAISANTMEQPWFSAVSDAVATPARALPLMGAAAALYTAALFGLRRLLTRPAIDASW